MQPGFAPWWGKNACVLCDIAPVLLRFLILWGKIFCFFLFLPPYQGKRPHVKSFLPLPPPVGQRKILARISAKISLKESCKIFLKKFKKVLAFLKRMLYNTFCCETQQKNIGLSPNGKATDSDSVISRFESLQPSYLYPRQNVWDIFTLQEISFPVIMEGQRHEVFF